MYAVSQQFLAALRTGQRMAVRVDSYLGGVLLLGDVGITDGSVTVDRSARYRRQLRLTVSDIALLPQVGDATAPLASYGQQLRVYRGLRFTDGTVELVPIGVFRVGECEGDVVVGPVQITADSLECIVSDDPFLAPQASSGYGPSSGLITALITASIPDAVVVSTATSDPAPAAVTWTETDNRWDAVRAVALAMGCDVYCDAEGVFRIVDIPDVLATPHVWQVDVGPTGVMVSGARGQSRTGVYNGVRVIGENTASGAAPVSSLAVDSDPLSPTRWGGPYGKVLETVTSSLITSSGQCAVAAEQRLLRCLGPATKVSLAAIPNPALEAGDVLRVVYPDGPPELHVIQSMTIPLSVGGVLELRTRSAREDDV